MRAACRPMLLVMTAWLAGSVCAAPPTAAPAQRSAPTAKALPAGHVRVLVQSSPLAGSQYHALPRLFERLKVGDRLELRRQPENRHDPKAVAVFWHGEQLGYLPRRENAAIAAALDRGENAFGRISRLRSVTESADPWQRLEIDVLLEL